ncbi:hypothetical protein BJ322DRAFT_1108566 [Thelephora terrestris]|uniref:Uncharacterized protein n=1 Tax=Thelephora terrestris TaxID=56493 RepID=A0A9P6HDU0_9AGAM|nr:hypothetical protein BJ322DRAFT_1108566 [Thelephora terrestris]
MLVPTTLQTNTLLQFGNFSDPSPTTTSTTECPQPPQRFPHIRAQLAAIARQHKDPGGIELDDDIGARMPSEFVHKVVESLDNEREDELKALLTETHPNMDSESLEQHVLDLMHKHRDDVAGVPFLFLTPSRRPISRPSSRASNRPIHPRPDTPLSAPSSPLAYVFRRPYTPATSPLNQPSQWVPPQSESPNQSPVLSHVQAHFSVSSSLPASPLSSPRHLNAKASEFRPITRPLSAASSNPSSLSQLRAETPSPDLWAPASTRASSNLAIAAPLTPDLSYFPRAATPNSALRSSIRPTDDEDDPFDPFASNGAAPRSFHSTEPNPDEWAVEDDVLFPSIQDHYHQRSPPTRQNPHTNGNGSDPDEMDPETAALLTDGMAPIDVLSSVFGATLPPSELEEALATNGYDFDKAITSLIDRAMPVNNQSSGGPIRVQHVGNRVSLVQNGGPAFGGRGNNVKFNQAGRQSTGGNRVCRYFLAGECLRADCRFSHDFERALCRFWLRGTCAKGETCEFLHTLPTNIDVNSIANAMTRTDLNSQGRYPEESSPPPDEFPTLDHANGGGKSKKGYGPQGHHDPGRTRFAAAVKKPAPAPRTEATPAIARRDTGQTREPTHHRVSVVAPRPSPRLKLRPPTLLPTLPTGESVNKMYMNYRSRALQLGAARNACLSRAADAWRRGDGAAAKRFSREGHELNEKMSSEMADAAGKLVKERAKLSEQVVRGRDAAWSDDPGDRTSRGKIVGAGLGVCLGIARVDVGGTEKLSPEERTEAALDLHGLHANEATEVLESFLLGLEREHFYGLAYAIVGEEKHTGTQDPARGASRARLAAGVREWLHMWGYPWSERNDGIICIDSLTHA